MEQLSEKLAEPEAIKHDNLSLLYPAIHKEFTEFRAMPFKVTTIYGSMAFLLLGWTFANRAILGWLEIFALMFLLALVTAYSYKYLASIEVHFRECAEALNRMQILLKAYEEGFYAKAFVGRIGASLFSPNWILAGLTREEIGNSKLNVHDFSGTSVRDVGFRYAQYFIALMFSVLTSWLALLLLNVSKLIVIWTDACPYCWS